MKLVCASRILDRCVGLLRSCRRLSRARSDGRAERARRCRQNRRQVVHRVSHEGRPRAGDVADHRADRQADDALVSVHAAGKGRDEGPSAPSIAVVHARRGERRSISGARTSTTTRAIKGRTSPIASLSKSTSNGETATIVTRNDWMNGDKRICEDERTLVFGTRPDGSRWIDFTITIKATDGDVTFGDTKEGTFAVRVADSMRVDAKTGRPDREQRRPGRTKPRGACPPGGSITRGPSTAKRSASRS